MDDLLDLLNLYSVSATIEGKVTVFCYRCNSGVRAWDLMRVGGPTLTECLAEANRHELEVAH